MESTCDMEVEDDEYLTTELNIDCQSTSGSCVACGIDTDEKLSVVSRGLPTLIEQCRSAGRSDLACFLEAQPNTNHKLHGSCRSKLAYTARKADKDDRCTAPKVRRKTRHVTGGFSFKEMCFLCGLPLYGNKDDRKVLSGEDFDNKLKRTINDRGPDEWATAVQGRVATVADLFAADAVYHFDCYSRFIHHLPHTPNKGKRPGRPQNHAAQLAFDRLCDKLETEYENETYTLHTLHVMMQGLVDDPEDVYTQKYLKRLLHERYGQHIYFASRPGRDDVVGFKNFCDYLLHSKHFADAEEIDGSEAERLVHKAAGLISAAIRESNYSRDSYPSAEDIDSDGSQFLPNLLQLFLNRIIKSPLKKAAIGQSLVQAARPEGCLMPLLFAVGVELDQCGVEQLHIKLSRMGYALTVDEIRRFKFSSMMNVVSSDNVNESNSSEQDSVVHFVADNVDHNVRTLDGHETFHGMGIISATINTNGKFGVLSKRVSRLNKPVKAHEAIRSKTVPIIPLESKNDTGLRLFQLKALRELTKPALLPPESHQSLNILWHVGRLMSRTGILIPNWSGFMQSASTGDHNGVANIEMLSILDLNPADTDCIYSTLVFVMRQAQKLNVKVANITFDQPLYIKAVDISLQANLDIVIRLGGFHTLMSFLGSIGNLMRGSGLEEVMALMYGPHTVEQILSGKAYARAIRGHFIVHAMLTELLLDHLIQPETDDMQCSPIVACQRETGVLDGLLDPDTLADCYEMFDMVTCDTAGSNMKDDVPKCESLLVVSSLLSKLKEILAENSRTSRLWLLYVKYVEMLKQFITAERTGNWPLHLHTVQDMLGLFAATGHTNYARAARLYLQQMTSLPESHPALHAQLMSGYHTVRRSERYWAGLSLDLVIEQTMMRAIKSRGGLTRGRGMNETVRLTWLNTLTECTTIRSALTNATATQTAMPDHIETSKARMQRDQKDFEKVKKYLEVYSPFRFEDNERLISLSSGVAAGKDDNVNCDQADVVGHMLQQKWDNKRYDEATSKRNEQIKNLASITSSCTIDTEKVTIDPNNLFHRLVLVAERTARVRDCFAYELTPYPMSLFKDGLMRKPDKPNLYRKFASDFTNAHLPPTVLYVVDGGYLLHKVRWSAPADMCDILPVFLRFLKKLGHSVKVVFDGYDSGPSIKDHEHARRSTKTAQVVPDRQVDINTKLIGQQEPFLSNKTNKQALINVLKPYLNDNGIATYQAQGDADVLIVSVALDTAKHSTIPVAVMAEDTDVMALLLHHVTNLHSDVYFVCDSRKGRGGKMIDGKCVLIRDLQKHIGPDACNSILAVHALGGCDSTSAVFGQGKGMIFQKINKSKAMQQNCVTLQSVSASAEDICKAGIDLFVYLYGGKSSENLADLRYAAYCSTSLSRRFLSEKLPPSEGAVRMHVMRAHLQAVIWCTLGETEMTPTEWGWKHENDKLTPIPSDMPVAPDNILSVVRCKCKGDCSSVACSCRKHGLSCVTACGNCRNSNCTNSGTRSIEADSDADDTADDTSDMLLSELYADDDICFEHEVEIC